MSVTDAMLTVSNVGFLLALLPAIRDSLQGRTTITLLTSVSTSFLLVNTGVALLILGQMFSGTAGMGVAVCWAFLAVQRIRGAR